MAVDKGGKTYDVTYVQAAFINNNLLSHINEIRNLHLEDDPPFAHQLQTADIEDVSMR